jgi:peptidoglycan hydrolase CwlO-like protein
MLKEWLQDVNLLLLPLIAAVGAFGREVVEWVRGRRTDAAQAQRSDMEVGKALRDELLAEIARQDAKIDKADEECQRRLDAIDKRMRAVQAEADRAGEEARSLRAALDHAEKLIATLKKQVAELTKAVK